MTRSAVSVVTEDDPTPMVLSVARTLRASARVPELLPVLRDLSGTVVVRSKDDPQAVTIRFADGEARVDHGAAADRDLVLIVDLADRFTIVEVQGSEPTAPLADAVHSVLEPPLPPWRDAATGFWEFTGSDPGMPAQLVVTCEDEQSEYVLGDGLPRYVISGPSHTLARVFTGTDTFLDAVFTGAVSIRGTLPQLSVMAGASLKVRFRA